MKVLMRGGTRILLSPSRVFGDDTYTTPQERHYSTLLNYHRYDTAQLKRYHKGVAEGWGTDVIVANNSRVFGYGNIIYHC